MTEAAPAPRRFNGFTLDAGRAALLDPVGTPVRLRPKSFTLLELLLDHAGQLVTRETILDTLWPGLNVTDDSITQCVGEIRRALGPAGPELLRTVPRRGYILEAVLEEHDPAPDHEVPPHGVAPPVPTHPGIEDAAVDVTGIGRAVVDPAKVDRDAEIPAPSPSRPPPGSAAARGPVAAPWLRAGVAAGLLLLGVAGAAVLTAGLREAPPEMRPALSALPAPGALAPPIELVASAVRPAIPAAGTASPILARQLYDQGRALAYRSDGNRRENWLGARALFEQAIAADPGFAPAFVEAAFTHTNMATSGFAADPAAELRQAETLVAEAARRDPDRADVQSARGAVLRLQRRPAEALDAYRRAVALDPGQHASRANTGLMLILIGRPEEAAEPVRTSLALAGPTHPFVGTWLTYLGIAALHTGEGDHGASLFQQSLLKQAFLPPDTRRLWLAAALALDGQVGEARQLVAEVRSRQPGVSIAALRGRELSDDPGYLRHQDALYRGLRLAELPD